MADSRYYSSLDVFDLAHDAPSSLNSTSAGHLRRSVSIFSRKGAATPEPTPPFILQAAAMRTPKPLSQRQRSWMSRSRSVCTSPKSIKSASPRTPQGTILYSVPPAKTIQMTALDEEMATSPNEEIISAISENTPNLDTLNGSFSSPQKSSTKSKSTTSLSTRGKSTKRIDPAARIGEWRDGVVYWDDVAEEAAEEPVAGRSGLAHVQPIPIGEQLGAQLAARKPNLSVTIPGLKASQNNERLVPTIQQPKPRRRVDSVRTSFIESPLPPIKKVSPLHLEPDLDLPIMSPPDRPGVPVNEEMINRMSTSRSSTSSSASNTGETAISSSRSSATSIEAVSPFLTPEKDKDLPPLPLNAPPPPPRTYEPYRPSKSVRLPATVNLLEHDSQLRPSRSMSELDICDGEFLQSPSFFNGRNHSPTLSQAEQDLQDTLHSIPEDESDEEPEESTEAETGAGNCCGFCPSTLDAVEEDAVNRAPSPAPSRAPTIPKRSRKREWRASRNAKHIAAAMQVPIRRRSDSSLKHVEQQQQQQQPKEHKELRNALRKAASIHYSKQTSFELSPFGESSYKRKTISHQQSLSTIILLEGASEPPAEQQGKEKTKAKREVPNPSASAENVLINILSALKSTDDLFKTALINKGMYRIYKANEMKILGQVIFNQSLAAWELCEWSTPTNNEAESPGACSQLQHTPISYLRCYRQNMSVVERLKRMILDTCQTFMRRETAFALSTPTHPNAARFNDAFWRIWCFCKIFGSNKGREDDITGQLDWLKGGLLANNQGCVATVNTNLDFEMSSVLLNAPDHFAKANPGGLSAAQLFDMTELWTCMTVLLQGYHGRVDEARAYGIFDSTEIPGGDVEKEEQALEEWTHFLLTLGPSTILSMASHSSDPAAGFLLAQQNGWTDWSPPVYNGSRSNFLKEPVAKSYEEQISLANSQLQDPLEREKKERSRQRVASLAAEIRLRRQSSAYKRSPYIDMSSERAMSVRSTFSTSSLRTPSSARPSPMSPTSLWSNNYAARHISPIVEESGPPPQPQRMSYDGRCMIVQSYLAGLADETSERAVATIVSMGFPPNKARQALKKTDMGDGLNIERAISWLLRHGDD